MKVIFLDIDGVLTSENFEHSIDKHDFRWLHRYRLFSQEAILNLYDIVWQTGAYLVLSSSWRYFEEETHDVQKQLTPYGLKIAGMTAMGGAYHEWEKNYLRGTEIKQYLDEHPEIENYVILDDDSDMLPEQMEHFVQCSWKTGLTAEMTNQAIAVLQR